MIAHRDDGLCAASGIVLAGRRFGGSTLRGGGPRLCVRGKPGLDAAGPDTDFYQLFKIDDGQSRGAAVKADPNAQGFQWSGLAYPLSRTQMLLADGTKLTVPQELTEGFSDEPTFKPTPGLTLLTKDLVLAEGYDTYRLTRPQKLSGIGPSMKCDSSGGVSAASSGTEWVASGQLLVDVRNKKLRCLENLSTNRTIRVEAINSHGDLYGSAGETEGSPAEKYFYLSAGSFTPQILDDKTAVPGVAGDYFVYRQNSSIAVYGKK